MNIGVTFSSKMHLLQGKIFIFLILMICVDVSKQSVIELVKTDEPQNGISTTLKPVDNSVQVNSTNHRKGRCKFKIHFKLQNIALY